MEAFSGLRARNRDSNRGLIEEYDSKCKQEPLTVRFRAFISSLINMKQRKGSQLFILVILSITSTLSWYYLNTKGELNLNMVFDRVNFLSIIPTNLSYSYKIFQVADHLGRMTITG